MRSGLNYSSYFQSNNPYRWRISYSPVGYTVDRGCPREILIESVIPQWIAVFRFSLYATSSELTYMLQDGLQKRTASSPFVTSLPACCTQFPNVPFLLLFFSHCKWVQRMFIWPKNTSKRVNKFLSRQSLNGLWTSFILNVSSLITRATADEKFNYNSCLTYLGVFYYCCCWCLFSLLRKEVN